MEEELAFIKLQGLVELQIRNGLKFVSVDKLNDKAYSKEVVRYLKPQGQGFEKLSSNRF